MSSLIQLIIQNSISARELVDACREIAKRDGLEIEVEDIVSTCVGKENIYPFITQEIAVRLAGEM